MKSKRGSKEKTRKRKSKRNNEKEKRKREEHKRREMKEEGVGEKRTERKRKGEKRNKAETDIFSFPFSGLGRQLDPDINIIKQARPFLLGDPEIRKAYIKNRLSRDILSVFRSN